ncbi:sigma-70 family RNA polymerase sigma factor [Paenibacillus sp. VCA1]|uniref:sigma-70 family RNA polymerase sigma factor n=1 Tax=Paenibacillus sp. VCA1 TaxID=3039148 RepID=UPI0028715B8E|nr:sigma-70 family RNA polymerase sigma factor [Paenibacillus sp. VCA1]MDR9854954.1 sigma-70 family RNA polymerase sigma factor [Paenibacillus sp. VCA1]
MNIDVNESEVLRAQKGDKEAFISLIKRLELRMYNIARSIVKKEEDCADAMQETVLKAYRSLPTLQNPRFFNTWMCRILINECNTLLRKKSKTVSMAEPPQEAVYVPQAADIRMDLRDAVDRLEETQRTIVILYYFEDMTIQQIADMLEMSAGAVKTRLYRARMTLSRRLKEPAAKEVRL